MFGLTASAGSPVRPSLLEVRSDKIARLRLDLELVYNSVAGRSTDDNVDSHGSPHGTVRGVPTAVESFCFCFCFVYYEGVVFWREIGEWGGDEVGGRGVDCCCGQ